LSIAAIGCVFYNRLRLTFRSFFRPTQSGLSFGPRT